MIAELIIRAVVFWWVWIPIALGVIIFIAWLFPNGIV